LSSPRRISGKTLGEIALPTYCPRCMWIRLHVPRLPYQVFPGIFSSIDSYTKRNISSQVVRRAAFPAWLAALGDVDTEVKGGHHTKFFIIDQQTNIQLTGSLDAAFRLKNGSHIIIDYKTSKFSKGQDALLPMYEAELNAYAVIGEQCHLSPVSRLALVYLEPVTSDEEAESVQNEREDGFIMGFHGHILPVTLNPGMIPLLLQETRRLFDLPSVPTGRPGCENCEHLDELLAIAGSISG
jgi:hypothetical protein